MDHYVYWLAGAIIMGAYVIVGSMDYADELEREAIRKERAFGDQYAAWMRRHEQAARECRGQQYIAQCCEDARVDITCVEIALEQP